MSRPQDSVIDDDDDCCPLCVEEFDLADKSYRPCPCGYLICQFCFNSLKTTYDAAKCPNCRRPYDEKTIEYKVPSPEEQKQDQLNRTKRAQAQKRKDAEKREVEASSRRNLAGVRVKQQNLVYVIGLVPQIKDEQALLQTLRGPEYFGQYGDVEKIVVSKAKPGAPNQGVGVYVTYARKEDAALCIQTIDGTQNGDRTLRAQLGTTKYCSAFLRHEPCTNKNCSFLHETGEDGQNGNGSTSGDTTRVSKQPATAASMAPPQRPQSTAHSVSSQPMARQGSKDSDSRKASGGGDGSALPSTASWAHALPIAAKVRRASQSTSRATPSPQLAHAQLASSHKSDRFKDSSSSSAGPGSSRLAEATLVAATAPASAPAPAAPTPTTTKDLHPTETSQSRSKVKAKPVDRIQNVYDDVLQTLSGRPFQFVFSDDGLTDQIKAEIESFPCLIDPYGGAKRRVMQNKEAERATLESEEKTKLEVQATSAAEDALDDESMVAGSLALGGEPEDNPRTNSARGAIGRPAQHATPTLASDQFASLSLNARSITPQHRQQQQQQQLGSLQNTPGPAQNTSYELSNFDRSGPQFGQAQYDQISNHQRHGSRYFNTDSKAGNTNTRFQTQQQPFFASGVQGPPPGLPASGTPPVSGGGMFAHGQNFTNPGFNTTKDANGDLHSRGRSATGGGADVAKRGGVEHLPDPSIVQARLHQAGNTAQGLFGGQQGDDETQFPPLPSRPPGLPPGLHSRVLTPFQVRPGSSGRSTPKIPPGFDTSHAHPILKPEDLPTSASRPSTTAPILPALPTLSRPNSTSRQDKSHDEKTRSSTLDNGRSAEISLGSPKPRQSRLVPKEQTVQATPSPEKEVKSDTKVDTKDTAGVPSTKPALPKSKDAKKEKPMKIDISALSTISNSATPVNRDAGPVATPPPITSRPATPATVASEVSRASLPKARTLRVTTSGSTFSKPVEQPPHSATTERSLPASLPPHHPLKSASRQPSISSISKLPVESASHSRPSTPAMSERLMSEGFSRAGSPPASIVGSAPERTKTKSQLKKERREKAKAEQKAVDATSSSNSVATPPVVEEVGPIVSRQKKQKKTATESKAAPAVADNQPKVSKTKAKQQEDSKEVEPSQPSTPAEPTSHEAEPEVGGPTNPLTLHDIYAALPPNYTSADIQQLLHAHTAPMSRIFSSLISSGDLSKDHPWFNPLSFNSPAYKLPPDNRKGQAYLDAHGYTPTSAFGYVYLPLRERRALERGSAVGVAGNSIPPPSNNANQPPYESLVHRTLITPNGVVYRHLTSAESERLLELEERRDLCIEEFGEDIGGMHGLEVPLEADDFINLSGGMEELARRGESKGVVWVDTRTRASDPTRDDSVYDEEDEEDEDDADDETGAFVDLDYDDADDEEGDEDDYLVEPDHAADRGSRSRDPAASTNNPGHDSGSTTTRPHRHQQHHHHNHNQNHNNHNHQQQQQHQVQGQTQVATGAQPVVNLRALDAESLAKRVADKQKELEAARKEMDKIERTWNKKAREWAKWREATLRV